MIRFAALAAFALLCVNAVADDRTYSKITHEGDWYEFLAYGPVPSGMTFNRYTWGDTPETFNTIEWSPIRFDLSEMSTASISDKADSPMALGRNGTIVFTEKEQIDGNWFSPIYYQPLGSTSKVKIDDGGPPGVWGVRINDAGEIIWFGAWNIGMDGPQSLLEGRISKYTPSDNPVIAEDDTANSTVIYDWSQLVGQGENRKILVHDLANDGQILISDHTVANYVQHRTGFAYLDSFGAVNYFDVYDQDSSDNYPFGTIWAVLSGDVAFYGWSGEGGCSSWQVRAFKDGTVRNVSDYIDGEGFGLHDLKPASAGGRALVVGVPQDCSTIDGWYIWDGDTVKSLGEAAYASLNDHGDAIIVNPDRRSAFIVDLSGSIEQLDIPLPEGHEISEARLDNARNVYISHRDLGLRNIDRDAYRRSFDVLVGKLPQTPEFLLEKLRQKIRDLNLANGISNSLDVKLNVVEKAVTSVKTGDNVAALNALKALINEIHAQSPTPISEAEAASLIDSANTIIELLQ